MITASHLIFAPVAYQVLCFQRTSASIVAQSDIFWERESAKPVLTTASNAILLVIAFRAVTLQISGFLIKSLQGALL